MSIPSPTTAEAVCGAVRCGAVRRGAVRRKEEDGQQRERANGGIKSVQDTGYIRIPCILYRYNLYHTNCDDIYVVVRYGEGKTHRGAHN